MSLKSTIRQIQVRERDNLSLKEDKDSFIRTWDVDLRALFSTIYSFLEDLEKEGLLSIHLDITKIKEEESWRILGSVDENKN